MKEKECCMNCAYLKTGRINECKKKRKNKEIIDIFYHHCGKYENNNVPLVSDYNSWKKDYKG